MKLDILNSTIKYLSLNLMQNLARHKKDIDSQSPSSLVLNAELRRISLSEKIDKEKKSQLGQFLTPPNIANFMSSLFMNYSGNIRLLDPGAGAGSLTAAFIKSLFDRKIGLSSIEITNIEIDSLMINELRDTLRECQTFWNKEADHLTYKIIHEDFIKYGIEVKQQTNHKGFTHCIVNPPYKKITNKSLHKKQLSKIGIEATNLYSGFLSLIVKLLEKDGELVAIVPRSFCNGVYFKSFRRMFLEEMSIKQIHIFDTRNQVFKDDKVLQENIIIHAVKNSDRNSVVITSSNNESFDSMTSREVPYDQVVKPDDKNEFIHIATNEFDQTVVNQISLFDSTLTDLEIDVSTGPVVDFRLKKDITKEVSKKGYPLIYQSHFLDNSVSWPNTNSKANSILESESTSNYLYPGGWYTLTKRFSSKEEKRRIVAAVFSPEKITNKKIGFENHLNVFHRNKSGLEESIAKGLAVYLNSTLVDLYFRQFSGHTQVNVTDLKTLTYPNKDTLKYLGDSITNIFPNQTQIDNLIQEELNKMSDDKMRNINKTKAKIEEALEILKALELPKAQQNERSALTLLALLDIKPDSDWNNATSPLMGITPIMEFCEINYGRNYAPNTRETFRRQTMHQFVDAGLAVPNPDKPDRPTNSPKWVYQITPEALELIKKFVDKGLWNTSLKDYMKNRQSLAKRYAKKRKMHLIPLQIDGKIFELSPGKHSKLIKSIVEEFGPRFAPGSEVLYIGDTAAKTEYYQKEKLAELNLKFDSHGKFPDVIIYDSNRNWLLLVESVTSHGPVDSKRHSELSKLFKESNAGLVYVTAFPDKRTMLKYAADVSWETEVWVADSPTHLIHFDGKRFLGPYDSE